MKSWTSFDKFVAFSVVLLLLYSIALLVNAHLAGENIAHWVWGRHQNQFSWYSRPLFLIPACYYAYRRKLWLIVGFMALLLCSLFWFAAPENVPEHVSGYLEWEKQLFFSNNSIVPLISLLVAVVLFLIGLFSAIWYRSYWLGLVLINIGTLAKIVISVALGNEFGTSAVIPSLSSLAIINFVAFMAWRLFNAKQES
ncbi:hypothetical protein [Arenicella xantha]|uniref:Uncharacterized protein n=1 Tax=Arenicella xantha TaxID=644221 RepID=A0A395JPV1_9GAMM|nr:hypothetical protein [Arenicella xantha]RBP53674.1 hypothetical protein DFR28_1011061 [Arenicella xantha]